MRKLKQYAIKLIKELLKIVLVGVFIFTIFIALSYCFMNFISIYIYNLRSCAYLMLAITDIIFVLLFKKYLFKKKIIMVGIYAILFNLLIISIIDSVDYIDRRPYEKLDTIHCKENELLGDDGKCYACETEENIPAYYLTRFSYGYVESICPNRVWRGRISKLKCDDNEELIGKNCTSKCQYERHPKNPIYCCENDGYCYSDDAIRCDSNLEHCESLI